MSYYTNTSPIIQSYPTYALPPEGTTRDNNFDSVKGEPLQNEIPKMKWHQSAHQKIDNMKMQVIDALGVSQLNKAQTTLDGLGNGVENRFEKMSDAMQRSVTKQYNEAIEAMEKNFPKLANSLKSWAANNSVSYKVASSFAKLAQFLITLPFKSACNIANLLYQTIKAILYGLVHPIEGAARLAKLLINIAHALTKPETWIMMGAGMIGGGLSQLALGNVLSPIVMILGAVFMAGGLAAGSLMAALKFEESSARKKAALDYLVENGKKIPEAMMTGFLMGLMIGGIQKAMEKQSHLTKKTSPSDEIAQEKVAKNDSSFIKQNHLSQKSKVAALVMEKKVYTGIISSDGAGNVFHKVIVTADDGSFLYWYLEQTSGSGYP